MHWIEIKISLKLLLPCLCQSMTVLSSSSDQCTAKQGACVPQPLDLVTKQGNAALATGHGLNSDAYLQFFCFNTYCADECLNMTRMGNAANHTRT